MREKKTDEVITWYHNESTKGIPREQLYIIYDCIQHAVVELDNSKELSELVAALQDPNFLYVYAERYEYDDIRLCVVGKKSDNGYAQGVHIS